MGKVYGFVNLFGAVGGTIGPITAGWIYDATNSYTLAWKIGIIASIIAAACFLMVGKSPYDVKKQAQQG
jgi:nitrate/nitrite transporter NarK